ncbi:MAG: Lrp/AsnC family transcriptional regulator [Acidimicrobiaceae bacterium]|nr:Lrp/AsnC family transcriptional regulator [Acidimicrobiaceae bacterium]
MDEIDTRLYEELQRDGRISMEDLAAVVGLSRIAVRARVSRLIQSGALRIIGVVHPSTYEIRNFAHLAIGVDGPVSIVGRAIANLDNVPLVSVVAGRFALIAEVRATNMAALRALIRAVAAIEHVVNVETAIYTERIKDLYAPPARIPPTKLDVVDRQILDALELDGRVSYAEIARLTHFSPSAIRKRVNLLVERGVVRISAVASPGLMGLQHMCGFSVRLRGGTESETIAALEAMDAVSYLSLVLGRCDAIGTLMVRSLPDLVLTFDHIRSLRGVTELESWMHLDVIKESYHTPNLS